MSWLFCSDFDLEQLPLTFNRSDFQRKFSFDFTPDSLYTPTVSETLKFQSIDEQMNNIQYSIDLDIHT